MLIVTEKLSDMRGPATAVSRAFRCHGQFQFLQSRGVLCLSAVTNHDRTIPVAPCQNSTGISATPAIKRRPRRGDFTDGRGVSTSTSETAVPTSFKDLNGVTPNVNRRRYSEMHFSLCFTSRMDTPPLPEEEKRKVTEFGTVRTCPPCGTWSARVSTMRCIIHRSTVRSIDRLISPRVNARESRILEYLSRSRRVSVGPMTHRLREH